MESYKRGRGGISYEVKRNTTKQIKVAKKNNKLMWLLEFVNWELSSPKGHLRRNPTFKL